MRLRKQCLLPAILAFSPVLACPAADWLNVGGDARLSGVQKREKILTVSNVGGLKLIWKLKLDGALTAPVILGHWITNRGTKELIFIGSASGNVYAVDADLGRMFWVRRLEGGAPAAPALAPGPEVDDDDDDVRQAVRPVYVAAGGRLWQLHPTTGIDYAPPVPFRVSTAKPGALYLSGHGAQFVPSGTESGSVLANGVRYQLDRGSPSRNAVLYALNAATGKQLYTSGNLIGSHVLSGALAVANGHVCFGTEDGTLYCFGFPVDL